MLVLLSDVNGTQIAFTDQSGNYTFTHPNGVSHNLRLTPSKSGYIFNPLGVIFISTSGLSGDKTVNFEGIQIPIVVVIPATNFADAGKFVALACSGFCNEGRRAFRRH